MSKLFRKRILFPIIALFVFVCSLAFMLLSTTKTYATQYNLYTEITMQDILNTELDAQRQGSKGVWTWVGLKEKGSNSFTVDSSFSRFTMTAKSTSDIKMMYLSKIEYSFTVNASGSIQVWYEDYYEGYNYTNGLNQGTIELLNDDENEMNFFIYAQSDIVISSFNMKLYYADQFAATITAGSGVEKVYLTSDYGNHTHKWKDSGYKYKDGGTVYALAGLREGYEPNPSWSFVISTIEGSDWLEVYLVGSKKINGAAINFGTITANPVTRTITLDNNGATGSGSVDLTYGQAASAPSTGFSRELFTFDGWNTKADGSGNSYNTNLSVDNVNEILTTRDWDVPPYDYINTLYAMWKINASGVETLIDNIGAVEFTSASRGRIKEARDGYDSLSEEEKAQVDNIDLLLFAEELFNALFERFAEAQIGNTLYAFLPEAFEALNDGDTITLRHDVDLSNENIEITKNLTVDLNGHILKTTMEDGNSGTPTLFVSSNNTIFEIRNSKPATGGLNGLIVVDVNATNSYVKVNDCRLVLSADNINNADTLKVGPGYEAVNINADGSADGNGFISIVKPLDVFDISNLDEDYIVPDGQTITGDLQNPVKISISDGASVTLKDLFIVCGGDVNYAAITCLGDAELIIEGANEIHGYPSGDTGCAAIFIPEGHTLTIDGGGILYAGGQSSGSTGGGAGIGGNANTNSGNIVINNGYIRAEGGGGAAGIGGGHSQSNNLVSGNITINGGYVYAYPNSDGAGIGSGAGETCGDITINGGYIDARGFQGGSGIGTGKDGYCGAITIDENVVLVKASADGSVDRIGGEGAESVVISPNLVETTESGTYTLSHGNTLVINGNTVTDSNSSGEGWSYDKDTNTLTLDGFEYNGIGKVYANFLGVEKPFASVISYEGNDPLTINLVGENTIVNTLDGARFEVCGVYSGGEITFTGTGSLSVSFTGDNSKSYAIAAGSTITIDGPTIEANAGKATDSSAGVYLYDDGLDMISGSLYAYGKECSDDDLSYGIRTANENITIGENVKALIARGYTNAIYGIVINAIEGIGWTDVDGTQGETKIEISPDGVDNIGNYKYISFIGITPEDVIGFINDIGNVEYTDLCKEKIDTARGAYDFLKEEEKAQVTNYNTLVEAENDYTNAGLVIGKINNIGDVEYTPEIKALIDAARTAYDALTQKAKNAVSNYNVLTQKEASYKTLDDNYKSSQVIELIKNIGTVTYSNESKKLIDNAKTEYDKLSTEAKALVTNYQTLTHDIEVYNHVDDVYKKIEAVKEVKYNDQTEEGLEAARIAYDNLTEEEKTLVINYDKLTTDEKTYSGLRNDHRTLVGWMIALGIMGGIILGLVIAYFLLFFVFNKWTLANGNPIRVFVIGKKNGKVRLLNMTLMIIYREENEVFNTKEELVK